MPRHAHIIAFLASAAFPAAPALAQTVETEIRTVDGGAAGTVTFEQTDHGVTITADLKNMPQGPHGFHIHETGSCSPDFTAAGGHYDPLRANHGFDAEGGYHVGDLPNIFVAADGTAKAAFFAPQITLRAKENNSYPFTLRDFDGSAIVVHAKGDDYTNVPAGSTGDRIACGVIFASEN